MTAPARRRALIVDDEELARTNLRYALAADPRWEVAGSCADAAEARAALAAGTVDLVFLDIRMPRETGLQLARELAAQPAPPLVVFVTAYDVHAVEAFAVHALDYLLKPLGDADLARALARADALLEQRQLAAHATALRDWANDTGAAPGAAGQDTSAYLHQLNVRSVGRIDCVPVDDVRWIEAAGNYVELHMDGRRLLHRVAIGALERRLDPACFVRVHRRALVRIDQVAALHTAPDGSRSVLLRCGASAPVSERALPKVRALLGAR